MLSQVSFNEYIKDFKKLELSEKKKILLNQLKMMASVTNDMCKTFGSDNEIIVNQELLNVSKENTSDEEYVEALIVLVNSIQNSISDFNFKISEVLEHFAESQNQM